MPVGAKDITIRTKSMKIIIVGAGDVGRNLATTLSGDKHDVVVIDLNYDTLTNIREYLDVMVIQSSGASIEALKQAGIEKAQLLIAASSDDVSNILACQIASHFGVETTICRLYSNEYFSTNDNFTPKLLGIKDTVFPEQECINKITDTLENQDILEKIIFSSDNAVMTIFKIRNTSSIIGIALKDFPNMELLKTVRFAAIVRRMTLIIPQGDTIIEAGDELYITGTKDGVSEMITWLAPENKPIKKIIIAGASRMGANLAISLDQAGFEVRVIENVLTKCENLIDMTGSNMKVIHGNPTNQHILQEAGIDECDAFIGVLDDEEENILSCVLAKRQGARKVIATTKKSEYIEIVPDLETIDCGFNSGLVAVNTVLRYLGTGIGKLSIDAVLHRVDAYVYEFEIKKGSVLCNTQVYESGISNYAVIALIFRNGDDVIVPYGNFELKQGDIVAVIATPETAEKLGKLMAKKKGLFK